MTQPKAATQEAGQPTSVWYVSRLPLTWRAGAFTSAQSNPQKMLEWVPSMSPENEWLVVDQEYWWKMGHMVFMCTQCLNFDF